MTSANVTAAKPKVGGAIYVAPAGTALPTDTTTTLDAAFKELGYASEDGLTNSSSPENDSIKAWGGDVVLSLMTGREDTFSLTLIEALSEEVLKLVHGAANVTGALATGLAVKSNAADLDEHAFVVDMIMRGGALKRVVIPKGKVTEIGEITYSDTAAVGYQVTITAQADDAGNTHYEYIKGAAAAKDCTLSALSIGSLVLSPTFAAGTTVYTAATTNASDAVSATATDTTNAAIDITVNGNSLTNGGSPTWATGANLVLVKVTNGQDQKTYKITVTKS